MAKTSVQELYELGQSIWLDNISRSHILSGKLLALREKGVAGLTSNPSIFEKSIGSSADYDPAINRLCESGRTTFEIYDELTVKDVQDAADIFMPVYERAKGADGFVSLEVSPRLAMDTAGTIEEAKRLHKKVNRKNLMLKVPATDAGYPAVTELIASGMNVNVTLIFSMEQYARTASAYLEGLRALERPGDVSSVASVFVSRIDTASDKILGGLIAKESRSGLKEKAAALKGRSAVANTALIYAKYLEIFESNIFAELKRKGARPQRALWASTGTKDPAYSDVKYISELTARGTVNTVPDNTLGAYLDHGRAALALGNDAKDARQILDDLRAFGIDINSICADLLEDGLKAFVKSFDSLLSTIESKSKTVCIK